MEVIAGKVFLTAVALFVGSFIFLYDRYDVPDWVYALVGVDVIIALLSALAYIWL